MLVIREDIDLTGKKFGNLLVISKGDPFLEKSKTQNLVIRKEELGIAYVIVEITKKMF